jgi:hypothetical protein
MRNQAVFATAAFTFACAASGHHSDVGLEMDAVTTFEGIVTEYTLRNPHSYFTVATTDENAESVTWIVQMGSAISVSRRGWTRDTLALNDRVIVGVHAARDGRPYGLLATLEKEGVPISYARLPNPVTVSTTSIEGRWIIDRASLPEDYPGGLDQLTLRDLALTEKGRAARAAFSQNSEENPELACISKPTPGGIVYTDIYPIEIELVEGGEIVMIRSQYFDQERTVYMDGRPHPDADQRWHEGHSIGRWEGDVLVVDTRNFADNRSPYQNGIPSGAQKHVVERYELQPSGTHLTVEFMLEDPEYLVGSMTHVRDLVYSPQLQMTPFNCDLEATRRYLPR